MSRSKASNVAGRITEHVAKPGVPAHRSLVVCIQTGHQPLPTWDAWTLMDWLCLLIRQSGRPVPAQIQEVEDALRDLAAAELRRIQH